MSEKTRGSSESQPLEPIEKVKLERVNGLRRRLRELLRHAALITGVGLASGGVAGGVGQSKYRDWMDYHPDEAKVGQSKEAPKPQEEKEAEGYLEKAKKSFASAKKIVGEGIGNLTEGSETVQQYRQTRKELSEIKKKFLEAGDKTAFWLPFVLTFLAAAMLANKILQVKKSLSERIDPVVERNWAAIETKLNQIVERVNAMQTAPAPSAETQAELARELNRLSSDFLAQKYEFEGNPEDR